MMLELVESLAAYAAVAAVLEQQNGPLGRLFDSGLERSDIHEGSEFVHAGMK